MENVFDFKLITGEFDNEEATLILLRLINEKIKFHQKENFSKNIKEGKDEFKSLKRIQELNKVKSELEQFLNNSSIKGQFSIEAEIRIKKSEFERVVSK